MAFRLLLALSAVLPLGQAASSSGQANGRVFVVVVDDGRYLPAEVENAGRVLGLLRDEVLTAGDLVSVVSTGRSSVQTDLGYVGDRRKLNEAIRRIVEGPPSMAVAPTGAVADAARLRYDAHVAFMTIADIVTDLGRLEDREKHVLFLASGATAAAVLAAAMTPEETAPAPTRFVRQGTTVDAKALLREMSELATAARRAEVTIHTVDARDPASVELLRRLK